MDLHIKESDVQIMFKKNPVLKVSLLNNTNNNNYNNNNKNTIITK